MLLLDHTHSVSGLFYLQMKMFEVVPYSSSHDMILHAFNHVCAAIFLFTASPLLMTIN